MPRTKCWRLNERRKCDCKAWATRAIHQGEKAPLQQTALAIPCHFPWAWVEAFARQWQPLQQKLPKARAAAPSTPRPDMRGTILRAKAPSKPAGTSSASGDKPEKKLSKKQLLESASCDIKFEDISQAAAFVLGKGQTKGTAPAGCPEHHKKCYTLVSVGHILQGEMLKKKLNGARTSVVVGFLMFRDQMCANLCC